MHNTSDNFVKIEMSKKNVPECCSKCGFNPTEFKKSIPDFDIKLRSMNEFGKGGALEHWRGALWGPPHWLCFTCAH